MANRRYINLPNRPPNLPFADAVLAGDTLYISGRIGIDPATGHAPADHNQEMKLLFDGFKAVLEQAGMTMDDLVSVTVFCTHISLWERFNEAYRGYFKQEFPARAFLGIGSLLRGGRFEMLGVAVKS